MYFKNEGEVNIFQTEIERILLPRTYTKGYSSGKRKSVQMEIWDAGRRKISLDGRMEHNIKGKYVSKSK